MGIKICPKCGGKVSAMINKCIHCGYDFSTMKKCPDCEENIDVNAKICPICGHPFELIAESKQVNNSKEINDENVIIDGEKNKNADFSNKQDNIIRENDNNIVQDNEAEEIEIVEDKSDISKESNYNYDNIEVVSSNSTSEVTTISKVSICPYCGSTDNMEIGIEFFMCMTCKGKYLNLNTQSSAPTVNYNNATTVVTPISATASTNNKVLNKIDTSKTEKATLNNISSNATIVAVDDKPAEKTDENKQTKNTSNFLPNKKLIEDGEYYVRSQTKERNGQKNTSKKSRKKLCIIIISLIVVLAITFGVLTGTVFVPKSNYDDAMSLLNNNVDKAIDIFENCSWGDSVKQACFAKARKAFKSNELKNGIVYMHDGKGEVYVNYNTNGGSYVDSGILRYDDITVASTKNGYYFDGWKLSNFNFSPSNYIVELDLSAKWTINSYNVTVSSSNTSAGSVSISETTNKTKSFDYDSSVTITATANTGYTFDGWYDGSTKVSTNSTYTFSMPSKNVSYEAKWTSNSYDVTVSSSNTSAGSVSISGTTNKTKSFDYDSSVTITATANTGYTFDGWYDGSTKVSTNSTYTFSMPSENVSYEAKWTINSYDVTVSSSNTSAGSVSISETTNETKSFDYDSSVTITATANTGYTFDGWYDGSTKVSTNSTYTFSMPSENVSYEAKWTTNSYNVTVSSSDEYRGTVTGEGDYSYGSSVTIVATPNANCYFDGWYKNDSLVSSSKSYTFTLGTEAVSYVAKFSSDDYIVILNNENDQYGSVSGEGFYGAGEKVCVVATPYTSYSFAGWYNGSTMVSSCSSYIFTMGNEDVSLKATWSNTNDFEFSDNGDETTTISGIKNKLLTNVIIPSEVNGKVVSAIGQSAFKNANITSITIPSSVKTIGASAFYSCSLTSINLNDGLESIGEEAFSNSKLQSITIPSTVKSIGGKAFYNASSLTSINVSDGNSMYTSLDGVLYNKDKTILIKYPDGKKDTSFIMPNSVKEIYGDYTFNRIKLTSITLSSSLEKIGSNAFYYLGCKSINLPSSLKSIGNSAFFGSSLTSITIPLSVTEMESGVFSFSSSLTAIYCESSSKPSGWNSSWNGSGCAVYWGKSETDVITMNSVTYLTNDDGLTVSAISYSGGKSAVIIPSEVNGKVVTAIGQSAFKNANITSITIPSSVKTIGASAFYSCSLTSINLNDGLESIGEEAFSNSKLQSITIPSTVKSIGGKAFYNASSLTSINVSDGNSMYSSLDGVLYNKDKTILIKYPDGKKDTSFIMPNSVKEIYGDYTFNRIKLTSITLSSSLEKIGSNAFYYLGCKSINLPSSLKSIGNSAFFGSSLTSITIPLSVTEMESGVFSFSSSLTAIYCESSSKPSGWNSSWNGSGCAVYWGKSETDVITMNSVTYLTNDDGLTVSAISYSGGKSAVIIPSEVNGKVVTAIGQSAFKNANITSITIPSSVKTIGASAFYSCSLTSINLNDGLESIGEEAFSNSKLQSITIPSTVKSIGGKAFYNASSLTSINVSDGNSMYSSLDGVLYNKDKTILIKYPDGKKDTSFIMPNSVKEIYGDYTFNRIKLTSITLSSSLEKIGSNAFYYLGCKSINLPSSLKSIGNSAFFGSSLTSITIPLSVTEMESGVFSFSSSLTAIYCESSSKPSGWNSSWNGSGCAVYWGTNGK